MIDRNIMRQSAYQVAQDKLSELNLQNTLHLSSQFTRKISSRTLKDDLLSWHYCTDSKALA